MVVPQVLPEYLCWSINRPVSQDFLQSRATGSAMRMIGKQALEALEITISRLEKQQRVIELNQLSKEEQRLLSLLLGKGKQLVNYQLSMIMDQL